MTATASSAYCAPRAGLLVWQGGGTTLRWALLAAALMGVGALGLEGASLFLFRSPRSAVAAGDASLAHGVPPLASGESGARSPAIPAWVSAARSTILSMLCIVSLIAVVRAFQSSRAVPTAALEKGNRDCAELLEAAYIAKRQELRARLAKAAQSGTKLPLAVQEFMTRRPFTVSPKTKLTTVAALMQRERIRHVLVCDGHRLLGVISDRDLLRSGANTAEECMSFPPSTITPETTLATAASLMLAQRINCLPVCENDRLVGIMTTVDLAVAMQCLMALVEDLMTKHGWTVPNSSREARGCEMGEVEPATAVVQ